LAGTVSAIAGIEGVLRYRVFENKTDSTDSDGFPRHSISAVVEGGDDTVIAQAIHDNKSIGCSTNGTTSVNITDPNDSITTAISFYRPTPVPIFVTINIHPLTGYSSDTIALIKFWVAAMINSKQIKGDVENSFLYWAAMSYPEGNPLAPAFSVSSLVAGKLIGSQTAATITIAATEVAMGDVNNIVINEV